MAQAVMVYATKSLTIRHIITLLPGDPESLLDDLSHLMPGEAAIRFEVPQTEEYRLDPVAAQRLILAKALGLDQDAVHQHARHAVVRKSSRMVTAVELVAPEFVPDKTGYIFERSDDAKLNDKIMADGKRLARVVTGDRDGKVAAVEWVSPDAIPDRYIEDSTAKIGAVVEALKLTDVPAEGTVKL